jgi:hypothetical protein
MASCEDEVRFLKERKPAGHCLSISRSRLGRERQLLVFTRQLPGYAARVSDRVVPAIRALPGVKSLEADGIGCIF